MAVKAFKLLADELDETDIVSIVTYAGCGGIISAYEQAETRAHYGRVMWL